MTRTGLMLASVGAAVAAILLSLEPARSADTAPLYKITKTVPLGAPDRWDYLTYDASSHRIYATHSTSIAVIDARSGAIVGKVPVPGANGVVVIPSIGKGYAGSRDKKAVLVFDLATFRITKELPADEDTDGVVYDPVSKHVFVMDGDPNSATVVDTATDTVTQLPLGGKPEFAAVDGAGKLFINITDKREIARVDTKTGKVDARWPISDCAGPHGLAVDPVGKRLFSTCTNSKMMVIDATDGRIVSEVAIGKGSDAAAFDPKRKLAFSSNGEGTLSVVRADAGGKYVSQGEITTQPLARTMTVDPDSGRIFMLAGERIEVDAKATDPRKRYSVRPGSASLLFLDPTS